MSKDAWESCLTCLHPDVIINLVALTVDECEKNPQSAFDANIKPLLSFISASSATSIKPYLVHISTDQVYDGEGPHNELSVRPSNVYATTKLLSEYLIKDYPSVTLRPNFFGMSRSKARTSLSDWIVDSVKSKTPITLFGDVLFSAIHIDTLCEYINLVIEKRPTGCFNVGASTGTSKAEFD